MLLDNRVFNSCSCDQFPFFICLNEIKISHLLSMRYELSSYSRFTIFANSFILLKTGPTREKYLKKQEDVIICIAPSEISRSKSSIFLFLVYSQNQYPQSLYVSLLVLHSPVKIGPMSLKSSKQGTTLAKTLSVNIRFKLFTFLSI